MVKSILAGLMQRHPLNIVTLEKLFSSGKNVGLVIVDEVNGFCTPGFGALAPPVEDPMVEKMIKKTDQLAKYFDASCAPILVFREAHAEDHPEPPYPPHCIKGTGEELLVPRLSWLTESKSVTIIEKSCINGLIGAIGDDGSNTVFEWIEENEIEMIIVVGICTDICVLQFVQAILSARNRDLAMPLKDVVVYTEGCATYNLPIEVAKTLPAIAAPPGGTTEHLSHDQEVAHYIGLYMMQMSGAILVDTITL